MNENRYQFIGLVGFIIAGFVFTAVGIKFGDPLTITGSVIWIVSCVIWMIPLFKSKTKPKAKSGTTVKSGVTLSKSKTSAGTGSKKK